MLHPNLTAHLLTIGVYLDNREWHNVPSQLEALMAECCRLQRAEDLAAFRGRRVPTLIVELSHDLGNSKLDSGQRAK